MKEFPLYCRTILLNTQRKGGIMMKKRLLIALVLIGAMAFASVASAANHVGVGYYFQGDARGLTLKGELALTDMIDVGVDYFGIENAGWADIYGSMDLKDFGDALVGAYGGIRLYTAGGTKPVLLLGVWGEQPVHPQVVVYGDAGVGVRLDSGSVKAWLEAVGGLMADVYDPFWLAGEVIFRTQDAPSSTGFRVLVGVDF
jgi:hypothetical protein